MKNRLRVLVLTCAATFAFQVAALHAQDAQGGHGQPEPPKAEPPMAGIHWAKGQAPPKSGGTSSPNLIYHTGSVMDGAYVEAIFWGPSWGTSGFSGDKITGLDLFYQGIGGSSYAATNSEYADSTGTKFKGGVSYGGHWVDTSTPANGNRTSAILAEVCKAAHVLVPNGYYPVYVDTPRKASYCAWHSWGTCGSTPLQFAFFFNLDGDAGCDPQDDFNTTGHSQGLAALANVSGHEISEALTDPHLNAWYDSSGEENADKCAWSFGSDYVTFNDQSQTKWKIQGNWSNASYNNKTGYANRSGQKGCIDGGNYK